MELSSIIGVTRASDAVFWVEFAAFLDSGDMTTFTAKAGEIKHGSVVVDAQGKVLGRLATQIAARLRGKPKPENSPHVSTAAFFAIVNLAKRHVPRRKSV